MISTYRDLAYEILLRSPRRGRTRVVAVDGGSGSGKTTIATRLARALGASLVHTDDIAWWESFFDWWPLMIDGVLRPLSQGRDVRYRPSAWEQRGRHGAVEAVAADAVVIEGVGSGRMELASWVDFLVWVDTDRQLAKDRGLERAGEDPMFWTEWERAEEEHLDRDRPWERADVLICNDPSSHVDHEVAFVVADVATWRRADRPG